MMSPPVQAQEHSCIRQPLSVLQIFVLASLLEASLYKEYQQDGPSCSMARFCLRTLTGATG